MKARQTDIFDFIVEDINHEEKLEKFECNTCGCFFYVNSRNEFYCPNCDKEVKIEMFKNREIKAKEIFLIKEIEKNIALEFVSKYHYLGSAKFFAKFSFGLFIMNELVGVATYSNPQGISSMKGWFNLDNSDQSILELSRLCMNPLLNGTNATSYLLSNSIKKLKQYNIRAVITLADSHRHVGSIYQICNFKYYGQTDKKTDFFASNGKVNPRGETKDIQGVWLPRTTKHRYAFILDKTLLCNYKELVRPNIEETNNFECCNGTLVVLDKRFNILYDCPKCCKGIL